MSRSGAAPHRAPRDLSKPAWEVEPTIGQGGWAPCRRPRELSWATLPALALASRFGWQSLGPLGLQVVLAAAGLLLFLYVVLPKKPLVRRTLRVAALLLAACAVPVLAEALVHQKWALNTGYCPVIVSTPVIDSRGNIYFSISDGRLFAFRPNGTQIWMAAIGERFSGVVSTPAIHGSTLYVTTGKGQALAMDLDTAAVRWDTKYCERNGYDNSAVGVVGDLVLVTGYDGPPSAWVDNVNSGDRLFALDSFSGHMRWSHRLLASSSRTAPAVMGGLVVVTDMRGNVYCLDHKSGALQWLATRPAAESATASGGVIGPDGVVYVAGSVGGIDTGTGIVWAYASSDGALLWNRTLPMVAGAHPMVFRASGRLRVVVGTGRDTGRVDRDNGHTWEGQLVSIDAETRDISWTFEPPAHHGTNSAGVYIERPAVAPSWSTPVADSDGIVYVGWHGGVIYAVDGATGREVSRHDLGGTFEGSPAVGPGVLVAPAINRLATFLS